MSKCAIDFNNAIGKSVPDASQRLEVVFNELQSRLAVNNRDLGVIYRQLERGEQTELTQALNSILERESQRIIAEQTFNLNRKIHTEIRTSNLLQEVRNSPNPGKALLDKITSPVETGYSIEAAAAAKFARFYNQTFLREISDTLGNNFHKIINSMDDVAVANALTALRRGGTAPNTPEGQIALSLHRIQEQIRVEMSEMGLKVPLDSLPTMPALNWRKMEAMGQGQFRELFMRSVDPKSGSPEQLMTMADAVYESVRRTGGEVRLQSPDLDVASIRWRSDEAFQQFRNQVGSDERIIVSEIRNIQRYSQQLAAAEVFGADYKNSFRIVVDKLTEEGVIADAAQLNRHFNAMTSLRENPDFDTLGTAAAVLKNVNIAAKAGEHVINLVADIPAMTFVAKRYLGMYDLSGMFSGFTSRETRVNAQLIGTFGDGIIASQSRAFATQINPNGTAQNISFKAADFTMAAQGAKFWENATRAGFTQLNLKNIGRAIRGDEMPEQFWRVAQRFNLSKADIQALGRQHLDVNGNLDIFTLPPDIRDRYTAWVQSNVSAAVVAPNFRDELALRLGATNQAVADTINSMTQILRTPALMLRKHMLRAWSEAEGSETQRIITAASSLAMYSAVTLPVIAMATQAKEFVRGNKPLAWDSGELWSKTIASSGAGVLMLNHLKEMGIGGLLRSVTGVNINPSDAELRASFSTPIGLASGLLSLFGNAAQEAYDGSVPDKKLWQNTRKFLNTVPGQNIWWFSGLYRGMVIDNIHQMVDPLGYNQYRVQQLLNTKNRMDSIMGGTAATSESDFSWRNLTER